MNFEEHAAKLLLKEAGIIIPRGSLVTDSKHALEVAADIGPCVIKAQVPTGKRGKAGGIKSAATPEEAAAAACNILGMTINGHVVKKLLVEERKNIRNELYLAIVNDLDARSPSVLFSTLGGMDIEEAAMEDPTQVFRWPINISEGLRMDSILGMLQNTNLGVDKANVAEVIFRLYSIYRRYDAELIEINPLVLTEGDEIIALDCKFSMDDSSVGRNSEIVANGSPETVTRLEARAKELGLKFIELDGSVGVLANGAGLTMTTMDVIKHYGGEPANFMEIGGESLYQSQKTGA